MKQADALSRALDPIWVQIKQLFAQHHFITIICGFFVILMVLSFYRFLRSISPALVGLILSLVLVVLLLHWTQTRTEPKFLSPMMDWLAPFFPAPVYKGNK